MNRLFEETKGFFATSLKSVRCSEGVEDVISLGQKL
jgi:hypothetical protein